MSFVVVFASFGVVLPCCIYRSHLGQSLRIFRLNFVVFCLLTKGLNALLVQHGKVDTFLTTRVSKR